MGIKCPQSNNCSGLIGILIFIFFIICLVMGPTFLAQKAVPDLEDYLEEEKHHMRTQCLYHNYTDLGVKRCTYNVECGDSLCEKQGEHLCILISVIITINSMEQNATLYESYSDAQKTDFECSTYECEDSGSQFPEVRNFLQDIQSNQKFECYYHPESPYYVYLETAVPWRVIAVFTTCVVMSLIGCWGLMLFVLNGVGYKKGVHILTCCSFGNHCSQVHPNQVCHRDVEEKQRIIQAIQNGQLGDVRRLLTAQNVNEPLYLKETFTVRRTTALCHAAAYGFKDIVHHLVSVGADVNKKNDARQNCLHCACTSVNYSVVNYCLTNVNCDNMINAQDTFHCTPLILLAKSAKLEHSGDEAASIARALIERGADIALKCKDKCNVLHYAVLNSQKALITLLIKSGCAENSAHVDGSKTPLTALLLVKDETNLRLLIEAGVHAWKDDQLQEVMRSGSGLDQTLCDLIHWELNNPPPLTRLCRSMIRSSIPTPNLLTNIGLLSYNGCALPPQINRFLQLEDLW